MSKSKPEPKQRSNLSWVFPENSASLISDILKKHNLQESSKEILEKWKRGQKIRSAILTEFLLKLIEGESSVSELVTSLQKELNISRKKNQEIINDLDKEILTPAIEASEKTLPKEELFPEQKRGETPEVEKPKRKDRYRESIE